MKKKDKIKEKWENYSIFSRYIRGQVKKEEEKAKEKGRQFTVKQAKSARRKYTRRARIMGAKLLAATLATGFIGYTLNSGYQAEKSNTNQQQIEQETQEQQPTSKYKHRITIKPQENKQFDAWKDTLKVNAEQQNNIKENIETEIAGLKTSEKILQYVKQQYVDEYNKNNKQPIKAEDIQITKSNLGYITKNYELGKLIYNPNKNKENSGVYTIKHNGETLEHIARTLMSGEYKQAYTNIDEQKETNTESIYAVIAEGVDYCIGYESYEKGETSKEVLSTYKSRLIKSVYEKEINNYQSLKEVKQTRQETDEELEQ